eukprot:877590-Lingulodinium_polyedra.AAC.1
MVRSKADLLCLQEARIQDRDRAAAEALASSRSYDLHVGRSTCDGALLAAAARRGAAWVRHHPLPDGTPGWADGRLQYLVAHMGGSR